MNKDRNNHIVIKNIGFSLLAEGKTLKVRADGYSMYPSVKPGAVIFIEPLAPETNLVPGEIIAWKRESGFVVHRLSRILKTNDNISYITRGDSCASEDPPVNRELIAGKVVRVENGSGIIKTSGKELISKPYYVYNRLAVWVLVRLRRILTK